MEINTYASESGGYRPELSDTAAGFNLQSTSTPPPIPTAPPPAIPNSQPPNLIDTDSASLRQWSNSISNMTTKVETTVRQWSTPVQKVVVGQPPKPEDHPTTITGEARRSDIRTVTPNYKYGAERPSYEMKFGSSTNLPEAVGDYKVKETQDHFKLQIIDPKVTSNANMPVSSQSVPAAYRRNVDFPSAHMKRSFLNLEPMEQRKIRSVETRPITTSAYLTESLDRHRDIEASRLREYLKTKEGDANKPWDKPDWPGPKAGQDNEQSIRELEEIKRTIETLQRAANEPKKDVSSATWQFSTQSFSPRSVVSINGGSKTDEGLLKVRTDLSPPVSSSLSRSNVGVQTAHMTELGSMANSAQSTMTREFNENYSRRMDRYASLPTLDAAAADARGTLIKIKDDKPRGIMKRRELETKDQMMYAERPAHEHWERREVIRTKPKVTETVSKVEEHKRTEEIERRVQRKERKEKKHRSAHRGYHYSGGQEMLGYSDGDSRLHELERRRMEDERWRRITEEEKRRRAETDERVRRADDERRRMEYERRQLDEERKRTELERRRLEEQRRREELERRTRCEREMIREEQEHETSKSLLRSTKVSHGAQTDSQVRARSRSVGPVRVERIYEQRRFSPSELNEAVREAYRAADEARDLLRHRSGSVSRSGYPPSNESYTRTVTTRRERDGRYSDEGRHNGSHDGRYNGSYDGRYNGSRYGGSIGDSLRRGEMKYNPNGEVREVHHNSSRNGNVHKSYSTRDVFDGGNYDDRRSSFSYRRGSQGGGGPFVEFPPTLPRAEREPPMPPPHRGRASPNDFYRPITKSRSYADWDEGRGFSQATRRRDDDMARLENEFRDSLLMPLPTGGGNTHEADHRRERIPGGYETYDRDVKSSSGRRLNRDGNPTQFSEASQDYSFKREQESDRRR